MPKRRNGHLRVVRNRPPEPWTRFPDEPYRRAYEQGYGPDVSDTDIHVPTRYNEYFLVLVNPWGNGEVTYGKPGVATSRRKYVLSKEAMARVQAALLAETRAAGHGGP